MASEIQIILLLGLGFLAGIVAGWVAFDLFRGFMKEFIFNREGVDFDALKEREER